MANKNALGSTIVRKSIVEYVNIYEVTETELNNLENGGQYALKFDIGISLISIAVTCIISLLSSSFSTDLIRDCFLFVAIIGAMLGIVLLILGWRQRKTISSTIESIKSRMKLE